MSSRSKIISKLLTERSSRESYLRAKLNQLVPSQIKALRLREDWTQKQLGDLAEMKQARISAMEKPGEVAFTLETLIRLASAFRIGLQVRFVPLSTMLKWDNEYSQDDFTVVPIEKDEEFLNPPKHSASTAFIFQYTQSIPVAASHDLELVDFEFHGGVTKSVSPAIETTPERIFA
jgi:transcriptional regulator with XRE-family HTH domain